MGGKLTNIVRIEESDRALTGLQDQIRTWAERRHRLDPLDQYRAHIDVLVSVLLQVIGALAAELDRIDSSRPVGEVYTECRLADSRMALVGRIWGWYRNKLDQRDDDKFGPLLAAADEVLWSLYTEVFDNAAAISGRKVSRGLVPLPYIEFASAPISTRPSDAPADLARGRGDKILRQFVEELPLPLIGLPLAWADAPWWLVLLGHEIGHQIQSDLAPQFGLIREFGELLPAAAGDPHAADRWRLWSQEIFADLCLLCATGQWGIWSVAEQCLAGPGTMLAGPEPGRRLPGPVTRLALLATAAAALGVDAQAGLRGIDLDGLAADAEGVTNSDLALAPQVAIAALGHRLAGFGSFPELFAFNPNDFRPGGIVHRWARALRAPDSFVHESSVRSGRLIACGAVAAWSEVAAIADVAERETARRMLQEALLRELTQGRQKAIDGPTRKAEPSAVPDPLVHMPEFVQLILAEIAKANRSLGRIETGVNDITNITGIIQDHEAMTRSADSDGSRDRTSWRVFISHTSELREFPAGRSYMEAVERAISACGHVVVDMADFPSADQPAAKVCQERVRSCQVYVGVLGIRYGSPVRDKPKMSYTELEFKTATEAHLDRLVFLLDTDAADVGIPLSALIDRKFGARQEAFRQRVRETGLVTQKFANPATLGQLVERSLRELAEHHRHGSGN